MIMMAAWVTELSLKTLLVTEGQNVEKGDVWGHELEYLYDALRCETKQELQGIHGTGLPEPYSSWKGGDSVENILRAEKDTFRIWRYLSGENEIRTEPKKLITVAYAAYLLHLERTELPIWPNM